MCRWKGFGLAARVQEQPGDADRAGGALGLLLHSGGCLKALQCGAVRVVTRRDLQKFGTR